VLRKDKRSSLFNRRVGDGEEKRFSTLTPGDRRFDLKMVENVKMEYQH
jgi:hypothetical protein